MSGPYVYTPSAFEPTPNLAYGPYTQRSPFIPPATLYPSSPYPPSSPYRPSSPYLRPTTPQGVHFDDTYWNPPTRQRRPSWHGGLPPSPYLPPPSPTGHHRRRSFGGGFRPWEPASPWSSTSTFQIHPLLNGEAPRADFSFDLAAPSFAPIRWIGPGQSAVLAAEELGDPATYPPITRMRITHDAIPQWPIDLAFHYDGYTHTPAAPPPIKLGDVLYMIHSSLHRQITHQDWAQLSLSQETAIARAYTRRCRSVPSSAQVLASQGVKRVDYLLERHVFKGLIRTHDEDGFYHWKLITA